MQAHRQSRATTTRSGTCTGGCGRQVHRCTRPDPICRQCKAERRPLADTPRCPLVILRKRQVSWHITTVRQIIAACMDRQHARGPLTPAVRRRVERRVLRCLARRGIATTFTDLPRPSSVEWRVMAARLEAVRRGLCGVAV